MKNRCGFCKAWCSFLFLVIIHTLNSLWFPSILSRFWSGMVLVNIIWSPFHQAVPPAKLTISHSKRAKFNVATRNSAQLFVLKCFHPTKKMNFVNFVAFSHIFYTFPNYISSWQTAIWIWSYMGKNRSQGQKWNLLQLCYASMMIRSVVWRKQRTWQRSVPRAHLLFILRWMFNVGSVYACFFHAYIHRLSDWIVIVLFFLNPSDSEYSWRWKVSPTERTVIVIKFWGHYYCQQGRPKWNILPDVHTHTHSTFEYRIRIFTFFA